MLEGLRRIKRKIPFISTLRFRKRVIIPGLALYGGTPTSEYPLPTEPYRFSRNDADHVRDIVTSGKLTHNTGDEIKLLEKEFGNYIGTKYSVATNSCTSALMLACKAIGIKKGDEVVVPAYTFVATAQAVLSCNGTPVFADIDSTFNISPESFEKKITQKTKAVIIVHMFGNVANLPKLLSIAKKHKLKVIEDCAQAIGAGYKGRKIGSFGDIGCFSFNEKKAIPTGQGGILTTSNKEFFEIAKIARNTGVLWGDETDVVTTGGTYFTTEMEAAIARNILSQLDVLNENRKNNYKFFLQYFSLISSFCTAPTIINGASPSFSRLAIEVDFKSLDVSREFFIKAMNAEGIPVKTFYPTPLYKYSLFSKIYKTKYQPLPFVEKLCKNQVAMEFSPYLTRNDVLVIVKALKKVAGSKKPIYHTSPEIIINTPHKKVNIGVIGLGVISEVHTQTLSNNRDVKIEALCDLDPQTTKQKSWQMGITKTYTNYRKLLTDPTIDTVDILLPHNFHYLAVTQALNAGKSVICEKPLATRVDHIKSIAQVSKKVKKNVHVKHYLRYSDLHNETKTIIGGGSLGKVYVVNILFSVNSLGSFVNSKSWKTNVSESGGGVLMDNGIHIIDFLISIFGQPLSVISSNKKFVSKKLSKGEEVTVTTLEFKDGTMANMICNALDTTNLFKTTYSFYAENGELVLKNQGKSKIELILTKSNRTVVTKEVSEWWKKANESAINSIINNIVNNLPPSIPFSEIESGVNTVLNAYKSSSTGKKYLL